MDNMSDNQINQKIGILLRRKIEARLITQFKKYLSSERNEEICCLSILRRFLYLSDFSVSEFSEMHHAHFGKLGHEIRKSRTNPKYFIFDEKCIKMYSAI